MLPHYTAALRRYVNCLALPWNRYQRANFLLLGAAFFQRRSLLLRQLARSVAGPGKAHRAPDKRLRRFLANERLDLEAALAAQLGFLLARLSAMPFVCVMLDWTFIAGRAILWAQIPYRGRALPLCVAVYHLPLEADEEGRTQAEAALLWRLSRCWPPGTPEPLLLLDRGFDKGPLLAWLQEAGFRFIVRIQRGRHLYDAAGRLLNDTYDARGRLVEAGPLHPQPEEVLECAQIAYLAKERFPLSLVVSAALEKETGKPLEWRLVTNLPPEHLGQVVRLYAQRMQPEGVHRDSKQGHGLSGFGLCHLGRLRKDRLERLLHLLSLLYSFLVLVAETERETRQWLCQRHRGLSLATFALDLLHRAGSAARQIARQACASVKLQPLWLQGAHS